ncbi:hypothetical protein [Chryseobacterium sp. MMS23-Vi53]|uniref:hypothetical protein n=1 Tax=Chryseobacterium sp. MMS23-Vi53 TaxID=3386644 RepID=UPI0039E9F736
MKLRLYIVIFNLFFFFNGYSQFSSYVNMPWNNTDINNTNTSGFINPKGSSLINYPFGNLSLNIPLYDIDENLPLSLSYSASSVKPNEHPSEVGLGWNLIAGGSIVREQKLFADEASFELSGTIYKMGYFFRRSTMYNGMGSWGTEYAAYTLGVNENWESPDVFHFNFLNYSGSFMMDETGAFQIKSDTDFKVEYVVEKFSDFPSMFQSTLGQYTTITKFRLIAPDGTIFTFGGDENAIDYTARGPVPFTNMLPLSSSKWNLTQIKRSNGSTISFSYQRLDPQVKINVVFEYLSKYYRNKIPWFDNVTVLYPTFISGIKKDNISIASFFYKNSNEKKYAETVIPNYPSGYGNITSDMISMRNYQWSQWFLINSYDDIKWNQLDKITINPLKIDYVFNYTNNPNERLKLLGITKKYNSALQNVLAKDENYVLSYNNNLFPDYFSGHGDHLGYNNGQNYNFVFTNDFLLPNKPLETSANEYASSRNPDLTGNFLYAELLTAIQYPTGEITRYEYEPHSVSHTIAIGAGIHPNSPIVPFNPGGFRIKSISYYDKNQFVKRKTLKYQKFYGPTYPNYLSSGILSSMPRYYEDLKMTNVTKPEFYNQPMSIFTSNGLHHSSNTYGNYVLYSKVYEVEENLNGENIGYTEYSFTNYDIDRWAQTHMDEGGMGILNTEYHPYSSLNHQSLGRVNDTYYNPISSNESQRGKLIDRKIYDNTGKLLKEYNYKYTKIGENFTKQLSIFRTPDDRPDPWTQLNTFLLGGFFKGYNYKYLVNEENEIDYFDNNRSVSKKKTYTYGQNYPNNLMSLKEETNTGETSTEYKYAIDQSNQLLIDNNIIKIPTVQEVKKGNQLAYKHEIIYGKDASTNNLVLPKEIRYYDNNNVLRDKTYIDLYDTKGNILQYREGEYGLPITIVWGYNKVHPILKFEGASYNNVQNYIGNAIAITDNIAMGGNIIQYKIMLMQELKSIINNSNLKQFRITGFTYDYFAGVTNVIEQNGAVKSYEYDKANRLINIFNNNNELLESFKYNYKN